MDGLDGYDGRRNCEVDVVIWMLGADWDGALRLWAILGPILTAVLAFFAAREWYTAPHDASANADCASREDPTEEQPGITPVARIRARGVQHNISREKYMDKLPTVKRAKG